MTAPVRKEYARALLIERAQEMRRLLAVYAAKFEKNRKALSCIDEVAGWCTWAIAYYAQEEEEDFAGESQK